MTGEVGYQPLVFYGGVEGMGLSQYSQNALSIAKTRLSNCAKLKRASVEEYGASPVFIGSDCCLIRPILNDLLKRLHCARARHRSKWMGGHPAYSYLTVTPRGADGESSAGRRRPKKSPCGVTVLTLIGP